MLQPPFLQLFLLLVPLPSWLLPSGLSALAPHFSSHLSESGDSKRTCAFNRSLANSLNYSVKVIDEVLGTPTLKLGAAAAQGTHVRAETCVLLR